MTHPPRKVGTRSKRTVANKIVISSEPPLMSPALGVGGCAAPSCNRSEFVLIISRQSNRFDVPHASEMGVRSVACHVQSVLHHERKWKEQKTLGAMTFNARHLAYPVIGNLNVADIDEGYLVRVLAPIWTKTGIPCRVCAAGLRQSWTTRRLVSK
jgi:hypothetical protein